MTDRAEHAEHSGRRRLPLAALLLLALIAAALVVLVVLYLTRRQLAREAVVGWLAARGVASESRFYDLEPGRLAGRLRIGRPDAPDLVVDRAELSYDLAGLIFGRGVTVTAIRLEGPVLRARWQGGRLTLGALDPLIAEFRRRPTTPGASPRIEIDHGHLLLASDYGALTASADAVIEDGKLVRLAAASAPGRFAAGPVRADLGAGTLQVRAAPGGRLTGALRLPFAILTTPGATLREGTLGLTADLAYPTPDKPLAAAGAAKAELAARAVLAAGVAAGRAHLRAEAAGLRWTRAGGERLSGAVRLAAEGRDLAASDLRLTSFVGKAAGDFSLGGAPSVRLAGGLDGRGAWSGLGAPAPADGPEIAALKRGLRVFDLSVRGIALTLQGEEPRLRLTGAARLAPRAGGEIRLAATAGGYHFTAAGGGLPKVEADLKELGVGAGGLRAAGTVKAALSIGPLQKAEVAAAGVLNLQKGVARFTGERCADVRAAKLTFGENDAERLSGRLCPGPAPLLTLGHGGWAIAGRAEQAAGEVPFLQAGFTEAAGAVRLDDAGGGLSADVRLTAARLHDLAPKPRFRPLVVSGEVTAVHDVWRGALEARTPRGVHVAHAELSHNGPAGVGSLAIDSGRLSFTPAGLQPVDLTPVVADFGSAAEGEALFTGAFHWTRKGGSSEGELVLPSLDFKSPAGQVSGLSGRIHFSSLAPLIAPPGQALSARALAAALTLTDLSGRFALEEKALVVSAGQARAGGGTLRISSLSVPLEPGQPVRGVMQVDGVEVRDLVAASPFGDRVALNAKVSGRVPFEVAGDKVRIAGGELHAVEPGRLSISRAALTSVSAQGSVQGSVKAPGVVAGAAANEVASQVAGTGAFTDFAYQALENLAFDKLDAQVESRPDGRLGVLFHIVGRHDPPKRQEITLSWMDLIRRKFMGQKLPLPSGTEVDLTLDTTLDLDDLLKDYAEFEELRSSPPVQR